jgi:hypothetical protein
MQWSRFSRVGLTVLAAATLTVFTTPASAELKPGDKLDKSNCQQAKGMLPDRVLQGYCSGEYGPTEIIEVPDSAFQYSKKFNAGSEANAGKYYVTDQGYMYETATKTWPHYWYGYPFPNVDEKDPQVAYKIMYNHQVARFQVDDIVTGGIGLKWVKPGGLDRSVGFGGAGLWFIGRHSGPIDNPDDCYLKDLQYGIAPYDIVGVASMNWWHTDPDQWQSVWSYVPTIRRVRRLTAANSSEGLFGNILARDDFYGWAGKIQYMNWKFIGVQDMLVPIAPGGIEKAIVPSDRLPSKFPFDPSITKDRGEIPPNQVGRVTWTEEERVKTGYEVPESQVHAWWPTNIKLAKRRCWVVEAIPKDPYYSYGRRVIYIDKLAYWAYWGEVYDRAGEYWKTFVYTDKMGYTPGHQMTIRQYVWNMGIDHRQNTAGMLDIQSKGYYLEYSVGLLNAAYSTSNLSAMGK